MTDVWSDDCYLEDAHLGNFSFHLSEEANMASNKTEGKVKQVKGKVNETVGAATGNRSQEAKGKAQNAAGKVQSKVGKKTGT